MCDIPDLNIRLSLTIIMPDIILTLVVMSTDTDVVNAATTWRKMSVSLSLMCVMLTLNVCHACHR